METIIAYKRAQMIEAREAHNAAHHKSPISVPIIFKDLIVVEEILSGFSPRYKFVELATQRRAPTLIEKICEICGKKIMAKTKHRKYCSSMIEKTGCCYRIHLKKMNERYQKVKKKPRNNPVRAE